MHVPAAGHVAVLCVCAFVAACSLGVGRLEESWRSHAHSASGVGSREGDAAQGHTEGGQ